MKPYMSSSFTKKLKIMLERDASDEVALKSNAL